MRVLRAKSVRKTLRLYRIVFGIEAPYHIILDATFLFKCSKSRLPLATRLSTFLQVDDIDQTSIINEDSRAMALKKAKQTQRSSINSLRLYVLQSTLDELYDIQENGETDEAKFSAKDAIGLAKEICVILDDKNAKGETTFDHFKFVIDRDANIQGKSSRKYMVATNDPTLRGQLSGLSGIPLLYLNQVTLVLEPPSAATMRSASRVEGAKDSLAELEREVASRFGPTDNVVAPPVAVTQRVKHKAKAPNPKATKAARKDSKATLKKKQSKYRK